MSVLLDAVNYTQHSWQVCGDLKVTGIIHVLQAG